MPVHVSSTCAHHQEVQIALHSLWYHHTYRWSSRALVESPLSTSALCLYRMIQEVTVNILECGSICHSEGRGKVRMNRYLILNVYLTI